jgi:hypothetical protein
MNGARQPFGRMEKQMVTGYNCYHGSGWRRYGRLIINFHNHQVVSVFLAGLQIM